MSMTVHYSTIHRQIQKFIAKEYQQICIALIVIPAIFTRSVEGEVGELVEVNIVAYIITAC